MAWVRKDEEEMDGREDVIDGLKGSAAVDELFVTGMLQ